MPDATIEKIEAMVENFLENLCIRMVKRDWANIEVTGEGVLRLRRCGDDAENALKQKKVESWRSCARLFRVLAHVYRLKSTGMHATKRDIYYMDTALFTRQQTVNECVDDVSRTFSTCRTELNVLATSKGLVAGDLQFYLRRHGAPGSGRDVGADLHETCDFFDVSRSARGLCVPLGEFAQFETTARFVLVVEKDCTFFRLVDDAAPRKLNCLLVTGRGFPCLASRRFLNRLRAARPNLPFFVLTDADPYGMHIASTYLFGSLALCHENGDLALPAAEWLGLTLADCDRYAVPPEALLECTAADVAKARELLAHPGISRGRPQWLKHIRAFIERGAKAEIQALHVHGIAFLTERFLPEKLALYMASRRTC
ncbi:Meiotic recombination protein SPO11-1 [Diplonema papillatum]|nr:Meiotic recombination protein SPO11-1 [Diplonema papillatum]